MFHSFFSDYIIHLKQSFYGGDEKSELYYLNEKDVHVSILNKLDEVIKEITGKESEGKYGRHYALDVFGVDIQSKDSIDESTPRTSSFQVQVDQM